MTTFEFADTKASRAFVARHADFIPAFQHLLELSNKCFGERDHPSEDAERVGLYLGMACRRDYLEAVFVATNGYGIAAFKILRGLYERAVALEYIRLNPDKARPFNDYSAVQDGKLIDAARAILSVEQVESVLGEGVVARITANAQMMRRKFQTTDCKKCQTTRLAFSWDQLGVVDMARKAGEGYTKLYFASYLIPNLHIHATLASAFPDDPAQADENRAAQDADFALLNSTLVFMLVLFSQNALFNLGLESELEAVNKKIEKIWVPATMRTGS